MSRPEIQETLLSVVRTVTFVGTKSKLNKSGLVYVTRCVYMTTLWCVKFDSGPPTNNSLDVQRNVPLTREVMVRARMQRAN